MDTEMYIGSAKIVSNTIEEEMVSYRLDNGLSLTATFAQFTAMASETPYKDEDISLRKWGPTMERMIQIAVDDGAQVQDFEWLQDRISEVIGKKYMNAMAKSMGVAFPKQVSLRQIDEILKHN